MNIRPARTEDLSSALEIYKIAREFMLNNGNPEQWGEVYPPDDLVEFDIENERLYILEENGAIEGVFAFLRTEIRYMTISTVNGLIPSHTLPSTALQAQDE